VVRVWIAAAVIFAATSMTASQAGPKVLPPVAPVTKAAPHVAPAAKAKIAVKTKMMHVSHCRCVARRHHHARYRRTVRSWSAAKRYAESYYDYHSTSTVSWYGSAPMQGEAVTLVDPQDFTGGVGYGVDGGDYESGGVWIGARGRTFMHHHGHFRHRGMHGHSMHR
jgi:hypothetical protein